MSALNERVYKKIEIDNPICMRRFHVAFEEGGPAEPSVKLACPHCGVTVFEAQNHPIAIISREENLVKTPDGSNPLIYDCRFLK